MPDGPSDPVPSDAATPSGPSAPSSSPSPSDDVPDDWTATDTYDSFPYDAGEHFVATVRRLGGRAAVDRAFTSPPRWTRDLFSPRGWYAGTLPTVTRPEFPGDVTRDEVADYGVLGELGFWLTISGTTDDPSTAVALSGWAGDAYVATDNGSKRWCITDDAEFTDTAARDRARAFLQPWADRQSVSLVDKGAAGLHLHTCHQG